MRGCFPVQGGTARQEVNLTPFPTAFDPKRMLVKARGAADIAHYWGEVLVVGFLARPVMHTGAVRNGHRRPFQPIGVGRRYSRPPAIGGGMNEKLKVFVAIICTFLIAGCGTTRGRPDYPYNQEKVESLTAERQFATLLCPTKATNKVTPADFDPILTRGVAATSGASDVQQREMCDGVLDENVRDAMIYEVLGIVDLKYNQFRNEMLSTRNGVNSSAKALTLLATTASSLTGSAGVKQNYNALTQLITGGVEIYDKEFLHSQTLFALVAQMDANRAKVRNAITDRMKKGKEVPYSGQQAYNDLLEYYQAGTILGALLGIQQDARLKEQEENKDTVEILKTRGDKQSSIM